MSQTQEPQTEPQAQSTDAPPDAPAPAEAQAPLEAVAATDAPPPADAADAQAADEASIDDLLKQATFEEPSAVNATIPPDTNSFAMPDFQQAMRDAQVSSIDLLRDVDLNVKIELGRSRMLVEDVLKLAEGSVVELDKLAGDPVDVFVNERLVARGEVLVLNDNFCVRINEIVAGVKEEGT